MNIPPVLSEETNVLVAISHELLTPVGDRTEIAPSGASLRGAMQAAVPGTEQEAYEAAMKGAESERAKAAGINQSRNPKPARN